jgi:hypothetical protein
MNKTDRITVELLFGWHYQLLWLAATSIFLQYSTVKREKVDSQRQQLRLQKRRPSKTKVYVYPMDQSIYSTTM